MGVNIGHGKVICPKCGVGNATEKVVYRGGDFAYCKNCKSTFSRVLLANTPEIKNDDPDFIKCPNCNFPSYRIESKRTYNCQKCKSTFINEKAGEYQEPANFPKKDFPTISYKKGLPLTNSQSSRISTYDVGRDEVRCPKCRSNQISANKKGFSGGNALLGGLLTGGIGLLAGTIGSNKIEITCLRCGNKFGPGDIVEEKPLSDIGQLFRLIWAGIVLVGFVLFIIKCG